MTTVDLNISYNSDTYDAKSLLSVKPLPFIAENCGLGFPFFNVDEKCDKYCIPFVADDQFVFQFKTGFSLTYIGWEFKAYDKDNNEIFSSILNTAGISGVTSAPTGDNIFWQRTYENGQAIDYFKINESDLSGDLSYFEIKFINKGLIGTDTPVLISTYTSPCYIKVNCSVLEIESVYDSIDCAGANYGDILPIQWTPIATPILGEQNYYTNKFKILGGLEKQSYDYQERQLDSFGEVTTFIKRDVYLLKTIIPEYVADHLINVLSGKKLTVNGKSYSYEEGFEKNNSDNSLWIVETELFNQCNKSNLC